MDVAILRCPRVAVGASSGMLFVQIEEGSPASRGTTLTISLPHALTTFPAAVRTLVRVLFCVRVADRAGVESNADG
jgi:hypothetical protein